MIKIEIAQDNFKTFFLYVLMVLAVSGQRSAISDQRSEQHNDFLFLSQACADVYSTSSQVKNQTGNSPDKNIYLHTKVCGGDMSPSLQAQKQTGNSPDKVLSSSLFSRTTGSGFQSLQCCRSEIQQSLTEFIPNEELAVIAGAAKRNGCCGDDLLILLAIRLAENGSAGREFGTLHPRAIDTNLDTQAGWAAATIMKNRTRWSKEVITALPGGVERGTADARGGVEEFITFLGKRYSPPESHRLNRYWVGNVKFWYSKFKMIIDY